MDKDRVFWGICFVLGAVLLITNQFWGFWDFSIIKTLIIIVSIVIIIKSLPSMNFWGILLPLAMIYTMLDFDFFSLWRIEKKAVWGAAILASIGLELLLKEQKRNMKIDRGFGNYETNKSTASTSNIAGEKIYIKNAFGHSTKYVSSDNFLIASIDNSFGSLAVYFDNAIIQQGMADIRIDNAFGTTNIYIPKNWKIVNSVTVSFGVFREHGKNQLTDYPTINISGSSAFGTVNVYYI